MVVVRVKKKSSKSSRQGGKQNGARVSNLTLQDKATANSEVTVVLALNRLFNVADLNAILGWDPMVGSNFVVEVTLMIVVEGQTSAPKVSGI